MHTLSKIVVALGSLVVATACADTGPTAPAAAPGTAAIPFLSGGASSGGVNAGGANAGGGGGGTVTDTTATGGGGGGGGGATGGGSSTTYQSCGTLSNVQSVDITVYTTRVGIGFFGYAANCGSRKEQFDIYAVDQTTDPACTVSMPHFIAVRNTDPGVTINWQLNSTLVPCQNALHVFDIYLVDQKTGQTVAHTVASAYL